LKYGNIYFYTPYPQQLPIHKDTNKVINGHGQNSSGKSYACAAYVAEEVTGKSQYREITKPPFGVKTIWIITTSFQIQLNSSQSLLFSNEYAPTKDIGLLPSLKTIEEQGGVVVWEKGKKDGILKRVVFPGRDVQIEFKSMESGSFNMAGAALDIIWVDEICPQDIYNELVTRVLRKGGQVIMSYLVGGKPVGKRIPGEWVVTDLYPQYEEDVSTTGKSNMSFYFLTVDGNHSLDSESVKEIIGMTTQSERAWRFSPGGKFNIQAEGTHIFDPYEPDLHLRENLLEQFNDMDILYRAWDLGYARPAMTAFQIDKYNRVRIMFSLLGNQEILNDFIERVQARTKELLPQATYFHELIPHDARRTYDTSPKTSEMIFQDSGLRKYTVIYVHAEESILAFNKHLSRLIKGEPAILVDGTYAALSANCMQLYLRDENTGKPLNDKYYIHLADNLKMIGAFLKREGVLDDTKIKWDSSNIRGYYPSAKEVSYGE